MFQDTYARLDFTDRDFDFIRELVANRAGINLNAGKRELVYSRLARRVKECGLHNFREYCDLLDDGNAAELNSCINALTTNVTSFFREQHHFEFLARTVLAALLAHARIGAINRLRIWSAGCSSGEEPYSIEMTVRDHPELDRWDARILATDLDSNMLDRARLGVYRADQLEQVSPAKCKRWFMRQGDGSSTRVKVKPELARRITFRRLNLVEQWPMRGPFDIIFCRNVVIYFSKDVQARLFHRFADILAPGGYLFLGHSETLLGFTERFESVGRTIYRKLC